MAAGRRCSDCDKKCWGKRCKDCEISHRSGEKAKRARRCALEGCIEILSTGNKNGFCAQHRYSQDSPDREGITTELGPESGSVYSVSSRIRTAEQAMAHANIDETEWRADTIRIKSWESLRRDDAEPVQMFGVMVNLKRRMQRDVIDAVEALSARLADKSVKRPFPPKTRSKERMLLEFSPFDAHFGKLAWGEETGDDYDLEIAERLFLDAFDEILTCVPDKSSIDAFVLPVGSDFFHTDTFFDTTTRGTAMDVDGRWAKMWEVGFMACVNVIERMRQIAPVEVVWVPGNHDYKTSFHLAWNLHGWFRNDKAVTCDLGPSPRKYVRYGTNLIGFTHGSEEKHASLPAVMATERPEDWARTRFHEWHVGDQHRRRAMSFMSVDSHEGVVVRTLPSISGSDAWHHARGYVGNRAAEAYLWSATRGYLGHFSANVES